MKNLNPVQYKITVEPDVTSFTFTGSIEIIIEADDPVTEMRLDALELIIRSCMVEVEGTFVECPFRVDPRRQEVGISLPEEMAGRIVVRIDYAGSINDKMAGFYRSRSLIEGKTYYSAVTQFQENYARMALPCFDHPVKKATFDVTMVIDEGLVAISNGPIMEERRLDGGKKLVRFQQTPKMSTYLLFFGVGEFEFLEDPRNGLIRVATMPGMTRYAGFGLAFGRKALKFCEDYYGIDYPLPKLDLIAIPDFAFGAMENWGAITFRENLLLHYPESTSSAGEQKICEIIAHEIVHQWFGNLVSPFDWKYLWLNESFATYFGIGIVHHYHPEWEEWAQFLHAYTDQALERDALPETVPIELPDRERITINSSTAPIIYNKGGSILRQVEGYIGADDVKKGLRKYLKDHEYGCASSHHLWEAFEDVSEKPIVAIMRNWVEQPGFPIVEAQRAGENLLLTQKRFTYIPHESDQQWLIPMTIRVFYGDGRSETKTILLEDEGTTVDIGSEAVAYKINDGQTGFYRVRYCDKDVVSELGKRVSNKELSSEDRWGLQNDLYALVKRGDLPIDDYLEFLSYYQDEDAFLPLMSIADNLLQAFLVMAEPQRAKIASVGRSLLERALSDIGLEPKTDESHTISILRDQIIWHAVLYGSQKIEDCARDAFESLVRGQDIHPDLMKSVMQVGALRGRAETFDWFDQRFRSSESEHERINILVALGCFGDMKIIAQTQQYVLNHVPSRNKFIPIVSMASNPHAVPYLWDWYVSNVDELEQFHPMHYERVIAAIVPVAGIGREKEVTAFFKDYLKRHERIRETITMALERLKIFSRLRNSQP